MCGTLRCRAQAHCCQCRTSGTMLLIGACSLVSFCCWLSYLWNGTTNLGQHLKKTLLVDSGIGSASSSSNAGRRGTSRVTSRRQHSEIADPTLQVCSPASSTPTFYFPRGRPLPSFIDCSTLGTFVSAHDYSTGKLTMKNRRNDDYLDARTTSYQVGLHSASNSDRLIALTSKVSGHELKSWCKKKDSTTPDVQPNRLLNIFAIEQLNEKITGRGMLSFPFQENGMNVYDEVGRVVGNTGANTVGDNDVIGGNINSGTIRTIKESLDHDGGPLSFLGQRERLMQMTRTERSLPPLWPLLLAQSSKWYRFWAETTTTLISNRYTLSSIPEPSHHYDGILFNNAHFRKHGDHAIISHALYGRTITVWLNVSFVVGGGNTNSIKDDTGSYTMEKVAIEVLKDVKNVLLSSEIKKLSQ